MGTVSPGSGITSVGPDGGQPGAYDQNLYTLSADFFWSRGSHSLKFGTLVNRFNRYRESGTGFKGSYTFSNLTQFLLGNALTFSMNLPTAALLDHTFRWYTDGFYVQDDWRAAPNLTLNIGLRYEIQTTMNEVTGRGSSLPNVLQGAAFTIAPAIYKNPSLGNFGPRFGFAWDVLGDNKTAVRGGFGIFYDIANYIGPAQPFSPPFRIGATLQSGLTFPTAVFPSGTAGSGSASMVDYNLAQPHMLGYNLTIERQLPGAMAVSVGYVGTRGINIITLKDVNAPQPQVLSTGQEFWTGTELRPNPNWAAISFETADSSSWYNALQVGFRKRLSRGFQFQSSYTWASFMDLTQDAAAGESGGSNVLSTNPLNLATDKGPADFGLRQASVTNVLYEVPDLGPGLVGKALGHWRLGTILTLRSGLPFTVYLSGNQSRSNISGGSSADRPNLVAGRTPANITQGATAGCPGVTAGTPLGGPNLYFDPCAYAVQPFGFLGTASRDFLQGPGTANWDFSLTKEFPVSALGEGGHIEFRGEIFNILNHPNFNDPVGGRTVFTANGKSSSPVALSTAGQITSVVSSPRQIQLALKLVF